MKSLIIFDLDGTLADSKAPLDQEVAARLRRLFALFQMAVISRGAWPQFQQQVLAKLPGSDGGVTCLAFPSPNWFSWAMRFFPSANDFPAERAGVLSIAVRDPYGAKPVIDAMVACRS